MEIFLAQVKDCGIAYVVMFGVGGPVGVLRNLAQQMGMTYIVHLNTPDGCNVSSCCYLCVEVFLIQVENCGIVYVVMFGRQVVTQLYR